MRPWGPSSFSLGTRFLSFLKNEQVGHIDPEDPVNSTILVCSGSLLLSGGSRVKPLN